MTELWLINVLLGMLSTGLGIAIKNLYSRIHDMDKEMSDLHNVYAKKEDVNRDFKYIRESLARIEEKLDKKVDK